MLHCSITVGLDASTAAEIVRYIVTELAHRSGATVVMALQVRALHRYSHANTSCKRLKW
jgi:hypothetical protein